MKADFKKILTLVFAVLFYLFGVVNQEALAQTVYTPPTQSASALTGIPFNQAVPLDEAYRKEFANCDANNVFKGQTMPSTRRCSGDKNNVKALLKFPDGTIFWESKLSLDIDGSWKACKGGRGPSDQCSTSFNWSTETQEPNKFVDPDNFPYIVIPTTNLTGNDLEFRNKTGIKFGDLGIVVYKDKVVPVFVADGGPHNKLGEGSSSLHQLIGEDKCKTGMWRNDGTTLPDDKKWTSDKYCLGYNNSSVPDKVLFFVFPSSRTEIAGLKPAQALAKIQAEAPKRFAQLKTNTEPVLKLNQPTSGQSFSVNMPVTFSGTAKPEVETIKASIGPGGPFPIAELSNVGDKWIFTQTFRNTGKNRPVTLQPFDANNKPLAPLTFTITIQ